MKRIYNGGQFVRLRCVRRRVMLMSAYLGPFDKQHGQGDGAVKCHVTSLDNCWKAWCLPGAAGFRATDEWQAVKPGSMQPGTFKSILTAALEEFYVQEERPQSVRSWCWTAASYVIPAKWGINEVSLRLIRNENKFVLYIDLKGTTTESRRKMRCKERVRGELSHGIYLLIFSGKINRSCCCL